MPKPVQASTYTFRHIIEGGFLYVDKTRYLYELVRPGTGIYFLARPRRFGKSLMISTLEEIFLGNKEIFQGLWIADSDYAWQSYPVIRIDFSQERIYTAGGLQELLSAFIEEIAVKHKLTLPKTNYQRQFRRLIQQLGEANKVVILIDEYDKPLIDNLDNLPEAIQIRDTLKNFYTIIKAMDQYIRFVFITGISKFSKVGVFSSMNNLTDLTMNPRFATAVGITEDEMGVNFQEHMAEFAVKEELTTDALADKIRQWYDGFCFVEDCPHVYNPFSTLQLFYNQRFDNYWFETGTPTFLIKLIKEQGYDVRELETLELTALGFSTYEIEELEIIPLLFQTGYLTIKGYTPARRLYQLGYPNEEVENAFLTHLLAAFNTVPKGMNEGYLWQMIDALEAHALDQFFTVLQIFFANIPYNIHLKYEKYYQTIFYLIFKLIGLRVDAEIYTEQGRIDAVIELSDHIFLFEFKLDQSAEKALAQIKDHEYATKYRLKGKSITLVGANFDSAKRQIAEWKSELEPNSVNQSLARSV